MEEDIPVGRMGEPEEIARAILFLGSEPYITGQILGSMGERTSESAAKNFISDGKQDAVAQNKSAIAFFVVLHSTMPDIIPFIYVKHSTISLRM